MIDAHCHLDSPDFDSDLGEVVLRAKKAGVSAVVNAGNCHADNEKALKLQERYGSGFFNSAIAISPHHANEVSDEGLEEELRFIESNKPKLVGIGETGLDRHHFKEEAQWERQEKFYRAFLQLGESLDLPVVVHSRDAEERCIRVAQEYGCRVMLHCFLEHKAADLAVESGFMVSVPTLKSKGVDRIIKKTPVERLFCETDSPWLWPGGRNEPANVESAYGRVARVKSLPKERVVELVDASVTGFFQLKR